MHREEMGAPMEHLDEGTAHAWLDGALPPDEAAYIETHVAECAECAAIVAEARGLIAGATRILGALDDVAGDVIPMPVSVPTARPVRRRPTWWTSPGLRAAAAVLFIAGASTIVLRRTGGPPSSSIATAPVSAPVVPAPTEPVAATTSAIGSMTRETAPASAAPAPLLAPARENRRERVAAMLPRANEAAKMAADQAPAPTVAAPKPAAAPAMRAMIAAGSNAEAASAGGALAGRGAVVGVVTDERGAPLPAARVAVTGTSIAATSDSAGRFMLTSVPAGAATIDARRLGYASRTTTVAVAPADTVRATVALDAASEQLSSVVVTAMGARTNASPAACFALRRTGAWVPSLVGDAPSLPSHVRLDLHRPSDADTTVTRTLPGPDFVTVRVTPRGAEWVGTATVGVRSAAVTLTRAAGCEP